MTRPFLAGAALAVALVVPSAGVSAQEKQPALAPAAAPDLKTFLFRASDAIGILRGLRQEDALTTLEFWARGTMTADGKTYRVESYRGSLRFHAVPAMRADITRVGPDGKTERVIEAVAGSFAWNESEPGLNGVAAPAANPARMLFVRTLPPGFLKGARAAGDKVQIRRDGAATVVTYPVAEVAGAEITATLNEKNLIERVQTKLGNETIETTFRNYADWNAKDYKADIWFPGHIVQTRQGSTILDLTVSKTNTYNPYVVVPVPAGVGKTQ